MLYSCILTNIKTKLLINKNKYIKLTELSENLINGSNFINKYINNIENMNKVIIEI